MDGTDVVNEGRNYREIIVTLATTGTEHQENGASMC